MYLSTRSPSVLRMAGMKWFLGKGVSATRHFIPIDVREASENTIILLRFTSALSFSRRLMSVWRSWNERVCFLQLLGVFSNRAVRRVLHHYSNSEAQASSSETPLYFSAVAVLLTPLMIAPRFRDNIKGPTNMNWLGIGNKCMY